MTQTADPHGAPGPLLSVEGLALPGRDGLVSFTLEPGAAVVIVGPPGSGKTTVIDLAARAQAPADGRITLFGNDLRRIQPSERANLRRRLGLMFQDLRLDSRHTVLETLALAARAVGRRPAEYAGPAAELLAWLGLKDYAQTAVAELDEDRRRRLALGRALINAPEILFADEPAGELAGAARRSLLGLIGELQRSGMAVILASRDESLAARSGANVVRLGPGTGEQSLAGAA